MSDRRQHRAVNPAKRTQGSQDNLAGATITPGPGFTLNVRSLQGARAEMRREALEVDPRTRMLPCPKCGEVYRRKRVEFVADDGTCIQTAMCERRAREMER